MTHHQLIKVLEIDQKNIQIETSEKILISVVAAQEEDEFLVGKSYKVFIWMHNNGITYIKKELPDFDVPSFQILEVVGLHPKGFMLDWGFEPLLFCPAMEGLDVQLGQDYIVYLDYDEQGAVVARLDYRYHIKNHEEELENNALVDVLITSETELGLNAIVNNTYEGLFYHDQIYRECFRGERCKAYVKKVRDDGRLDLIFQLNKLKVRDENMQSVLDYLQTNSGEMTFTDKSDPEDIYNTFNMSKKAFKRALGNLFKDKHIRLEKNKTTLNS
ncbi:MAG: hypothetical protein ACPGTG_03820 [Flavobacteriales bacterium]